MHRTWLQFLGVGVMVASGTLVAQSPDSTTSREVISATGCVQRAGAEHTGEGVGNGFLLQRVRVAPAAGLLDAPRASRATPSSDDSSRATNSPELASAGPAETRASRESISPREPGLLLVADRGVDLDAHVGHRVLVTGRLSSFAAPGGVASTASGRTLTVTKVSLIAPACATGS